MPEPAIRKHVTNACSYKLILLSEVLGCSFELRTIRLLPFSDPAHKCRYTHMHSHTCIYTHICASVYACVHSLMHTEPRIWFKLPGCSSAAVLSRRVWDDLPCRRCLHCCCSGRFCNCALNPRFTLSNLCHLKMRSQALIEWPFFYLTTEKTQTHA